MNITTLLILSLATWRISSLLVNEDGPKDIFLNFRKLFQDDEFLTELFECVWCLSIWIGAIFALGWYFVPEHTIIFISLPFALSAVAILIDRYSQ